MNTHYLDSMRDRAYWAASVIAYWASALWLLQHTFRISVDGSGLVASFFWGRTPPVATAADYLHNSTTRAAFLYPYYIAASIITLVGCGLAIRMARLWRPTRWRLFFVPSCTALCCLLSIGALSDLVVALNIWSGPRMYNSLLSMMALLEVVIPLSFLSGLSAVFRGGRWPSRSS